MAGTLVITTLSDGTNSTSSTNCIQGSARAWVNFNGVTTASIRASYNVSSVTRNGTGDYTVNFTTAFSNANYSSNGLAQRGTFANGDFNISPYGNATNTMYQTASAFRCLTVLGTTAAQTDSPCVTLSFFG